MNTTRRNFLRGAAALIASAPFLKVDLVSIPKVAAAQPSIGLDDYEEGSFQPVVDDKYVGEGRYIRVGNVVHFHIEVRLEGTSRYMVTGSNAGEPLVERFRGMVFESGKKPKLKITGLPFTK